MCVCVGVRMYVSDNRKHHGKLAPFVCMCNSNRYRCVYDEHRKRKRKKQNKKKDPRKRKPSQKKGMNGLQKQRGNNPHHRENMLVV